MLQTCHRGHHLSPLQQQPGVAQTHAILAFSVEKTLPDLCAHAPEVYGDEGVLQDCCQDHRLLGATTTPTTLPE